MSESSSNASGGGVGFTGLLLLAFIVLKLTHYIDWSWWWVLSPIWISLLALLAFVAGAFAWIVTRNKIRERRRIRGYYT